MSEAFRVILSIRLRARDLRLLSSAAAQRGEHTSTFVRAVAVGCARRLLTQRLGRLGVQEIEAGKHSSPLGR